MVRALPTQVKSDAGKMDMMFKYKPSGSSPMPLATDGSSKTNFCLFSSAGLAIFFWMMGAATLPISPLAAAATPSISNVEKIEAWMKQVHKIHEEKGMGWVSPYGCPEDGQQAYDSRGKCLEKLTKIVDSINSNFDG